MPKFKVSTIRARLLIGFVLVTLLPAIGISVGSVVVGYFNGRQQAIDRLESVAALKKSTIEGWIHSIQEELVIASNTDCAFERISVVVDLAHDNIYYDFYNKAVRNRLQGLGGQSPHLEELFLLDVHGRVALSTNVAQEGQDYRDQDFFQRGLQGPYAQLPFEDIKASVLNETNPSPPERPSALVAIPIVGMEGQTLGVIAARASIDTLDAALRERTGLGESGQAYLVDQHHIPLTGAPTASEAANQETLPPTIHTAGVDAALEDQRDSAGVFKDYRGVRVVGVYRWLPDLKIALAVEQDLSEAFGAILATIAVNLGVALGAVLLAVGASLLITRSIADPLVNLVKTATQIAEGDLARTAPVERDDEVGALARAFNSMTAQLRDLINSLEQRVKARTRALQEANQALQRRALQLETSAQVSREVTSILDIDDLLTKVVERIEATFGYYHVHIFLLDQGADMLVLRASSDALSPQLKSLAIGRKSINSRAVKSGTAQVVNDVTQDPHYLPDQYLPETRAELVIPLRLGDQVIGTLDVHSVEVDAFTGEDVLVIQSLGDQIAIAIENARLYDRSRELAVLEERTRLARELHDSVTQSLYSLTLLAEGWRRLVSAGGTAHVEDYLSRIGEITQQALKELRLLIHEWRPPALEKEGLLGALHQRLDAVEKRAGVEARLLAEALIELPAHVEGGLYRIAQEALNNALKHAAATEVTVRIGTEDEMIVLEVTDNGHGFDVPSARQCGGIGLVSMAERARQLGGTLNLTSTPGQGTTVCARVLANVPVSASAPVNVPESLEEA